MAQISCSRCGESRIEKLPYCQICGKRYRVWPTIVSIILVASVIIWFSILIGFRPSSNVQTPKNKRTAARDKTTGSNAFNTMSTMTEIDTLLKDPRGGDQALRQAIQLLDNLLEEYPQFLYGLRLKASLHGLLRDDSAATKAYQTYLEWAPQDAHARLALLKSWIRLGAYDHALKEGTFIYEQHPQFLGLLSALEKTYTLMENPTKAALSHAQWKLVKEQEEVPPQPPRLYHPKDPRKSNQKP